MSGEGIRSQEIHFKTGFLVSLRPELKLIFPMSVDYCRGYLLLSWPVVFFFGGGAGLNLALASHRKHRLPFKNDLQ